MRKLRLAAMLASLALAAAACGGNTEVSATEDDAPADSPTADSGDEATEGEDDAADSLRLAMILPGTIQDADYNAIAYEALDDLEAEHGIETEYSESVAVPDAERVAREYISSGADVVAFHGGQFLTIVTQLAGEFPDTIFIAESSGQMADQPDNVWNIARYFAPGFYVQGALAALQSESGTIAFLGGIDIPDYKGGANAMFAGARSVREDIELLYTFNGDQNDAVKGRQSADALMNQGADVLVLGLNNGIYGVAEAAQNASSPVYMTSQFTDKQSISPDLFMNSVLWDFGGAFSQAIEGILAGQTSGVVEMNPQSGLITLSPIYNVAPEVEAQIQELFASVASGDIEVPVKTDEVVVP